MPTEVPVRRLRVLRPLLPILAVALAGCSDYDVARQDQSDSFTQEDGNLDIDILWVMDNSGTMSEEQENVVANLSSFVDVLDGFGADWQVGVVTTSADDGDDGAGQLVGPILTPLTADVATAFASEVDVGVNGDINEEGLRAMELATSDPLITTTNAGFLRQGADLAVVILSDEDDHSDGSTDDFTNYLTGLKGEGRARLSAVVGQLPAGCASPYAAADPAERYLAVSEATGGIQDSICRDDFSQTMKALALNALGLKDTFQLLLVPEPSTIEVRLDGVLLYNRPVNGWQYDPGQNAIVLDGYAIPGPGSGIEVRYFEWLGGNHQDEDTAGGE
jgi:hypothetical protein